mmetsp:Transcript_14991/g.35613  ORF Transcript_14991/g.35613 Transcript_14991/m.35613 type:complete len:333 (+) Transcript_14991:446-1444(+)
MDAPDGGHEASRLDRLPRPVAQLVHLERVAHHLALRQEDADAQQAGDAQPADAAQRGRQDPSQAHRAPLRLVLGEGYDVPRRPPQQRDFVHAHELREVVVDFSMAQRTDVFVQRGDPSYAAAGQQRHLDALPADLPLRLREHLRAARRVAPVALAQHVRKAARGEGHAALGQVQQQGHCTPDLEQAIAHDRSLGVVAHAHAVAEAGGQRNDGHKRGRQLGGRGTRCDLDVHRLAREQARPERRGAPVGAANDHLAKTAVHDIREQLSAHEHGDGHAAQRKAELVRGEHRLVVNRHVDAVHQDQRARARVEGALQAGGRQRGRGGVSEQPAGT